MQTSGKVYSDGLLNADGLGPGDYRIVFDAARLQQLGINATATTFTVAPQGGLVQLEEIVPGTE